MNRLLLSAAILLSTAIPAFANPTAAELQHASDVQRLMVQRGFNEIADVTADDLIEGGETACNYLDASTVEDYMAEMAVLAQQTGSAFFQTYSQVQMVSAVQNLCPEHMNELEEYAGY